MTFYFTEKLKVIIRMDYYVESVLNEFQMKIGNSDTDLTPAGNDIY